ncbi:methyltransferase domain-containing protein [Streptomyces sp. NPDC052109]|uniref:class I SAM-dependent methyltransferase n=1 Tax=Streptomyces sp. NPDC052109 TaxID=3155527 RepID=UPI003433DA8B
MLPRLLTAALHRFNATYPWDHNAHYHRWLLRQLPRRFRSALDVGCGSGDLARTLAPRAESVVGVDADPEILASARELTGQAACVTYTLCSAPDGLPPGPYDVITCVAVLHHLPFAETLARLRRELAPGGTLVVVGCARAASRLDHAIGLAAIPLNALTGWLKNHGRPAPHRPVHDRTHPGARDELRRGPAGGRPALPGARFRRRLFWRYTLVWRAP